MPDTHAARLARAYQSLQGLSCGDCFGERFFIPDEVAIPLIEQRSLPAPPWCFTDDTMMATSIVATLERHQEIDQDYLARHFAENYSSTRGYGPAMHELLLRIRHGADWREEAAALFHGQGSFGNGSAMRITPLGAYFADDLDKVIEQAEKSAVVTHCHPEAVAGAIATAVGAAFAWRDRANHDTNPSEFLRQIHERAPDSVVRNGIEMAMRLSKETTAQKAARTLGSGLRVSCPDTVPFVLWCAARNLHSYEQALWSTLSGLGDRDTTCAMVGGIVVMATGIEGIPAEWLSFGEPIPPHLLRHKQE